MKFYRPAFMQCTLLQYHAPKTVGEARALLACAIRRNGRIFDVKA